MMDLRIIVVICNSTLTTEEGLGNLLQLKRLYNRNVSLNKFKWEMSINEYIIHHTRESAHRGKDCILTKETVNTQQLDFTSQIKEVLSNFSCNTAHLKPSFKSISKTYC